MIDGYRADSDKLADINLMYETLNDMPTIIGMHKVGFPHIIQFTEGEISGLSGFIFIIESHISIHTYSKKGFLSMDMYSCKKFDHIKAERHIQKIYGIKDIEKNVVKRGKKFHNQNIQAP